MRRSQIALAALVVSLASLTLAFTSHGFEHSVPASSNTTTTATQLVNRFFTLVEKRDVNGLNQFLSPAFQIERADGSGGTKAQYLSALPTITSFSVSNVVATQTGSVMVVTYLATIQGVVNGKTPTPGAAPRLSVFVRQGSAWRLVAHANFNPLTG